jgi:xanthosine phosphorylase
MGPNDDQYGPRFISMENALDLDLRNLILKNAEDLNIKLHEGVYVGVSGPMYETPAEIKVYKMLGGDLVGMSTVADIIVARHCGMKVICIAAITNFAAGLNPVALTHEEVLENAKLGAGNLIKLINTVVPQL